MRLHAPQQQSECIIAHACVKYRHDLHLYLHVMCHDMSYCEQSRTALFKHNNHIMNIN